MSFSKLTPEDAKMMIGANVHLGERNANYQMASYLYGRNKSGNHIINIEKTFDKIVFAARAIAAIENPQDIAVVGTHSHTSRAVLKCCRYIGGFPYAGRFTPGTFTNQIQRAFREPLLLICHDPRNDHQAIQEASYVNIPVIAFCDADSSARMVDIVIPCNTRHKHSIGLMFWMLAREVKRIRGEISREIPWDVMVDLFFYRTADEQEQVEQLDNQQGAITTAGVMASMAGISNVGGSAAVPQGVQEDDWQAAGWDNEAVNNAPTQLAPGSRAAPAAGVPTFGAVGAPTGLPTLPTGTDWTTVAEDWNEPSSWN